ncbi:hypothetical protein [Nocardia brasiliensis]|uniref:hypothetical protein n=1 Tax=Nocardia brasiliensis TaxID=37326 RepID=UPI003D8CA252
MGESVDWSWLRTSIPVVDVAMYLDMPEDTARTVEIRDGMIVHRESPSPNHVAISDNKGSAARGDIQTTGRCALSEGQW